MSSSAAEAAQAFLAELGGEIQKTKDEEEKKALVVVDCLQRVEQLERAALENREKILELVGERNKRLMRRIMGRLKAGLGVGEDIDTEVNNLLREHGGDHLLTASDLFAARRLENQEEMKSVKMRRLLSEMIKSLREQEKLSPDETRLYELLQVALLRLLG